MLPETYRMNKNFDAFTWLRGFNLLAGAGGGGRILTP